MPSSPGFIVSAGIGTLEATRHAFGVLRPKKPSSIPCRMSPTVARLPSGSETCVEASRKSY